MAIYSSVAPPEQAVPITSTATANSNVEGANTTATAIATPARVNLSIPLDNTKVQDGVKGRKAGEALNRRDSLKRRDALLRGKEGSRRRQRWENDHLLHVPNAQPPLPQDWQPLPLHPITHVPYYLAPLWDLRAESSSSTKSNAKKGETSEKGRVPLELKRKLKKRKGAKSLLQELEEEVRRFVGEYQGAGEVKRWEEGKDEEELVDSEDEEIVFVGRNVGMSDLVREERRKREVERVLKRERERKVWEGSVDERGGGFGRIERLLIKNRKYGANFPKRILTPAEFQRHGDPIDKCVKRYWKLVDSADSPDKETISQNEVSKSNPSLVGQLKAVFKGDSDTNTKDGSSANPQNGIVGDLQNGSRIGSPAELLRGPSQFLAGRFAAKEAIIKAHHSRRLTYQDINIYKQTKSENGMSRAPLALIRIEGSSGWEDAQCVPISISHDGDYATATCIAYEPSPGAVFETAEDVTEVFSTLGNDTIEAEETSDFLDHEDFPSPKDKIEIEEEDSVNLHQLDFMKEASWAQMTNQDKLDSIKKHYHAMRAQGIQPGEGFCREMYHLCAIVPKERWLSVLKRVRNIVESTPPAELQVIAQKEQNIRDTMQLVHTHAMRTLDQLRVTFPGKITGRSRLLHQQSIVQIDNLPKDCTEADLNSLAADTLKDSGETSETIHICLCKDSTDRTSLGVAFFHFGFKIRGFTDPKKQRDSVILRFRKHFQSTGSDLLFTSGELRGLFSKDESVEESAVVRKLGILRPGTYRADFTESGTRVMFIKHSVDGLATELANRLELEKE
ncbi:hypothetical protein G7Y89_g6950 [Cudoniella acicularis]|uniref:R3H-associated N-terminal domain-containing protein n=1 Tax=Cudoniella acicularis TaxID=354080 RepID=A0A8H4W2E0_9HELO|nr:hypothetical protein G7Y89_g6950 [Cudoniella acicularis]